MHVRAVLAGGAIAKPFSVQFGTNDTTFNKVATAQFQFFSVPPGAHSVRMQFRTQVAGQTVFISRPVTSVFYSQ